MASDSLKGRRTGETGNNIAAHYIASFYENHGLKTLDGASQYFQPIDFEATSPPKMGSLEIGNTTFIQSEDLLILTGDAMPETTTKAVFAGQGWIDEATGQNDYEGLDVKGKVVFVLPGTSEGNDPNSIFGGMSKKRKFAEEQGAIALIELYRLRNFPWSFFKNYFGKETIKLSKEEGKKGKNDSLWMVKGARRQNG